MTWFLLFRSIYTHFVFTGLPEPCSTFLPIKWISIDVRMYIQPIFDEVKTSNRTTKRKKKRKQHFFLIRLDFKRKIHSIFEICTTWIDFLNIMHLYTCQYLPTDYVGKYTISIFQQRLKDASCRKISIPNNHTVLSNDLNILCVWRLMLRAYKCSAIKLHNQRNSVPN